MSYAAKIKRLSKLNVKLTDQVSKIYDENFPESESSDFSNLISSVAQGERLLLLAELANNVVGFAFIKPLACRNIYFLEYLAIAQKMQSKGIGGKLLRYIAENLFYQERAKGILLEVEPAENVSEAEQNIRRRRIEFYRRHGAYIVSQTPSYRVPNLAGSGTLDLKLMYLPLDKTCELISESELRNCIVSIFVDTYGRSEDDPILKSVLEDLSVN